MIKVCYCKTCGRIFYKTSKVNRKCPKCDTRFSVLPIAFEKFTKMNDHERNSLIK